MSRKNSLNANIIIERVKKCLDLKTNIELAKRLEIKPNTISTWKKRGNIDLNKIISICEPTGVSMDWLLYGNGEEPVIKSKNSVSNDPVSKIMDMLESMTEEQQRDVLKYVKKEKLWEELMKTKKVA